MSVAPTSGAALRQANASTCAGPPAARFVPSGASRPAPLRMRLSRNSGLVARATGAFCAPVRVAGLAASRAASWGALSRPCPARAAGASFAEARRASVCAPRAVVDRAEPGSAASLADAGGLGAEALGAAFPSLGAELPSAGAFGRGGDSASSAGGGVDASAGSSSSASSPLSGEKRDLERLLSRPYKYGFSTAIESDTFPPGLDEDVVRAISAKKGEPEWLLAFRLSAFRRFLVMAPPDWADLSLPGIDLQRISYYSAPKAPEKQKQSLDEVDPELLRTFDRLGIPLGEQKRLANVAVDAVFDSVSVATTFKDELAAAGVIFCSLSEAAREHPELVKRYLGSVVPPGDNYWAALNAAVFSDGSFVYVPRGVRCPMEISTYFRINARESGQFERTLIVCEDEAYVSYLEGCTAPAYDSKTLHAAVVELRCGRDAEIRYSTVQNWYAGDARGAGGVLNLVTKRGLCHGERSRISWTQVETGSAVTWKYPSVVLLGDGSVGEFRSVALTTGAQQADTGSKMVHLGKNTRSRIVSKGICAGTSSNSYRGLVRVGPQAADARNASQCDSMLLGDTAHAGTFPYIDVHRGDATVEHEASTSKIGEDQLFYFAQRGVPAEEAVAAIVSGFCRDVFDDLPLEFAAEVNQLMSIKLEGSVG